MAPSAANGNGRANGGATTTAPPPASPPPSSPRQKPPRLGPLLQLEPPFLERSFWERWRPALLTADLIFAAAPLLTITSDAGRLAVSACPLHPLRVVLVPLLIVLLRARLGDAACWRLRPFMLAAYAYLASAGNNCYVRGLARVGDETVRRLAPGPCALAAAAAAAADPSTAEWPQGLGYALMQTIPATGSMVYALLLPVSFRARLLLQTIEVLATLPAALPLAVRVIAPYLSPPAPSSSAAAAAAAAALEQGGACVYTRLPLESVAAASQAARSSCFITRAMLALRCPAILLAICYGLVVGFIFPLAVVYYGEAVAKEAHLQTLALQRVAAAAHHHQQQSRGSEQQQRALPPAAVLLASASARPLPDVLRFARLGGVCVVAMAASLLAWRVADAWVGVAAQLWPQWLDGRLGLCPGLLAGPAAPLPTAALR
jgi:hypothetical protein